MPKSPIFSARFISAGQSYKKNCPKFKKSFTVSKPVKSAKLYISALGVYVPYLNGERVSDDLLSPGWTKYEKRLQYNEYPLNLKDGENELTVWVGSGWYASALSGTEDNEKRIPELIAAVEIRYCDATCEIIATDDTWLVSKTLLEYSDIYNGETVDARIDEDFREYASVTDSSTAPLIKNEGEPIRITEEIAVKEVIHTPRGEVVLDFGQNLVGALKFTIHAKCDGERYVFDHGEILDFNGNFYNDNYRIARARIEYTARAGEATYSPMHTFFGFRYVRVTEAAQEIRAEDFKALVIHSDMKRTGYFKCGNEKINKLYENVIWGQRGNFLDIPTDCPQRNERLGWTGDAEVFSRTACLNYDTERFFRKWLREMIAAQYPDGRIPRIVPNNFEGDYKEMASAAWADAATVVPYEVYLAFGDKALLRECYPMMKKWVSYVLGCPGKRYLWQGGEHFGDWLGLDAPEGSYKGSTSEELIASAYFYLSATILKKTAGILGYPTEKYERLTQNIKRAFLKEYVKGGKLISDTQTAHVITLYFGLCEDEPQLFKKIGDRLVSLIEENGDRLTTGFVGTPYLLHALEMIGRSDKAYTLLLQEKFPSWLFSVNMGATTIWEHWDGMREDGSLWSTDMNSFNHYAYGAVASWLYAAVCGIKYDEEKVAYKHFTLAPIPSRSLGFASARLMTRYGEIVSEWLYEKGGVRYDFTVPEGTTATLVLGDLREELSAGKYTRYEKLPR